VCCAVIRVRRLQYRTRTTRIIGQRFRNTAKDVAFSHDDDVS
jgi:hypothetical protein